MIRPVRLADVAKAAGVSHGTASNAFNRPEIVREEVRERVFGAARDLGYTGPDPKGRLLRAGRVNAVGVVVFDALPYFFEDPYARRFMAGIGAACDARGAGLSLVSAASDERADWSINTALVDGFLLYCLIEGHRLIDLARARGLPFVVLDYDAPPGADVVGIDDRAGARLAGEHIVALGHREVGVLALDFDDPGRLAIADAARIRGIRYGATRNRLHGYLDAVVGSTARLDALPVFETINEEAGSAAAGVDALLSARPGLTALLCMSDTLALGAIRHLKARGLRVPEDISVIGFDDVPEGAVSEPPLTTVAQPIAEKGKAAVDMIYEPRVDDAARVLILPLNIVVRASTAPPRPIGKRPREAL